MTFYSEGKNYWPHLSGLLTFLLENSDIEVCYVSSCSNDPGLVLEHQRLYTFLIGDGFIRNWFFENLETDVMVMTMPDLHQYQVKRSKSPVHYVYVQHSLVSLHMAYREGAFDYFDTIFCSGPHHELEVNKLVKARGLRPISTVAHGYGRLDSLRKKSPQAKTAPPQQPIVLIAPTWGDTSIIEFGAADGIIKSLLEQNCQVILRPHPQTLMFSPKAVSTLVEKYAKDRRFSFEAAVDGEESLLKSDIMISDWSGAALEYALGLNKPVIFIDVPRKVNNAAYEALDLDPLESSIREEIGVVLQPDERFDVREHIDCKFGKIDSKKYIYNVGNSDAIGANYILGLLNPHDHKNI